MPPITFKSTASETAQRNLAKTSDSLSRTYERLSSGLRINRASDDAAGLSIAESLKSDSRVYAQGIRNLNDGLSLLNVADGAIEALSTITTRITELAEQAANGAFTQIQRSALNAEAQALSDEFTRIARSTKFNGRALFDTSMGTLRLQGGFGENGGIASGLGGAMWTGFSQTQSFNASDMGYSLSLGDVNGDGNLDMAAVYGGRALIRLGNGAGSFGSSTSYVMDGTTTHNVVLGDINGDGVLDLVTAGYTGGDGSLSARLGTGNGTFGGVVSYSMGMMQAATSLTLGDVNGDGRLDAITSGAYGSANVRLGNGDGTFQQAVSYSMANQYVAIGDLNGDGILDMAAVGGTTANVRLGNGNGTFGSITTFASNIEDAHQINLVDVNGDGILDSVISGTIEGDPAVSVRLGNNNGTFGTATAYTMAGGGFDPTDPIGLQVADINGDGIQDLLTGGNGPGGGGGVSVRLGAGDGTFLAVTSYRATSDATNGLALGDLNNDGVMDLITIDDQDPASSISTFLSTTTSGIQPLIPFSLETVADARQALPILMRKSDQLSSQRGVIGAFQSRLSVATNNLTSIVDNYRQAEGRIRDADIASDSADLVRLNILQQASTAVLAQANLQPGIVISLLSQST